MQIPSPLPQFNTQKALIIVTGKKSARYFTAYQNEINKIHSFSLDKVTYSDREGFFQSSGETGVISSGSVLDDNKQKLKKEFLETFPKETKKIINQEKPELIYLFTPDYLTKEIPETLPPQDKTKLETVIPGNFLKHHPNELLEKINAKLEKKVKKEREKEEKNLA